MITFLNFITKLPAPTAKENQIYLFQYISFIMQKYNLYQTNLRSFISIMIQIMKRIFHRFVVDVFLFNWIFAQITLNYTLINSKKYNNNMVFSFSIIKTFIKFRKLENFWFSCVGLFLKFCLNLFFSVKTVYVSRDFPFKIINNFAFLRYRFIKLFMSIS